MLKVAIDKYRAQYDDFQSIPYSADIGITRLDAEELKLFLLPSP